MLTDTVVQQLRAEEKDYKRGDSGGLYIFVATSGRKTWRLKYRHAGKEKRLVLGTYPEMKLKAARARRDEVKMHLREGKDPMLEAKRQRIVNESLATETFEKFARAWFEAQKPRWKPVHANDVITSLENDLFPAIGRYPIHQIDEPLLLAALKEVEDRGAKETARRLRQRAERIFKYARAHGSAAKSNPAIDVREAMAPLPKKRRWPAITEIGKLRTLVRDVDRAGASPVTRLASRFLGLTAQRPGMVRGLPWSEIEGVDWSKPDAP
ncbi:MAG: integrase arm-type DNA-binding domain-containing protein [Sphingomonas phyllosphaerae]|uniref:tyrosine-type recombinase/integrase n=1 Tax=Sphingomonas phyllosphaerae TaxID=257003 RepID=UPI002FFD05E2